MPHLCEFQLAQRVHVPVRHRPELCLGAAQLALSFLQLALGSTALTHTQLQPLSAHMQQVSTAQPLSVQQVHHSMQEARNASSGLAKAPETK
jgi:hypothetical protein